MSKDDYMLFGPGKSRMTQLFIPVDSSGYWQMGASADYHNVLLSADEVLYQAKLHIGWLNDLFSECHKLLRIHEYHSNCQTFQIWLRETHIHHSLKT